MSGSGDAQATIEPEAAPVTTEPLAGNLNVQTDSSAEAEAAQVQKKQELTKLEDEIVMLRSVLNDKVKQARALRIDLGVATPLDNLEHQARGLERNITVLADGLAQNQTVQNTQRVLADVTGNAVDVLGNAAGAVGSKFAEFKESETMNKLTAGASSLLSTVSNTASNIIKPQPKEFNDGVNS